MQLKDITYLRVSRVITVTARDTAGNAGTDTLTVTHSAAVLVQILRPEPGETVTSYMETIRLEGMAVAQSGLRKVEWRNGANGNAGTCRGRESWQTGEIEMRKGTNVITITATGRDGQTATATLTVVYTDDD